MKHNCARTTNMQNILLKKGFKKCLYRDLEVLLELRMKELELQKAKLARKKKE